MRKQDSIKTENNNNLLKVFFKNKAMKRYKRNELADAIKKYRRLKAATKLSDTATANNVNTKSSGSSIRGCTIKGVNGTPPFEKKSKYGISKFHTERAQ